MKVGFVQFEPVFGDIGRNIEKVEQLLEGTNAELVVLPELFNTGYVFTSREEAVELSEAVPGGRTTEALCRIAREKSIHIVAGLAEKAGDRIYNSAVLVSPEGYRGTYRKIHLFGEETIWFEPGDRGFQVYDIGTCRLGIMICFDWFFPESARILALKGADILCHSANLVLPFCQEGMVTRCLENHVFAVTANRIGMEKRGERCCSFTGGSQITGPNATVLYRAGSSTEEVAVVDIDMAAARDKKLNCYNDLFKDRRTAFYGDLWGPVAGGQE
jgi:predicted amidohydrolase